MALRRSPPTTSEAETTLAGTRSGRDSGPTTEPVSRSLMTTARHRLRGLVGGAALATLAVTSVAACTRAPNDSATNDPTFEPASSANNSSLAGVRFDVRRDPGCGCCVSWVEYMRTHGAIIDLTEEADRAAFRADRGVADEAASCHTAVVDGYTIEGHVPVGAIERLLAERPDALGLALPGMPIDAAGMGGDIVDWESQPVMLIGDDGQLAEFDY